jgi:hypothetical protein
VCEDPGSSAGTIDGVKTERKPKVDSQPLTSCRLIGTRTNPAPRQT